MIRLRIGMVKGMNRKLNGMTSKLAAFVSTANLDEALTDMVRYAVVDCYGVILAGAKSDVAHRVATGLTIDGQGKVPVFGTEQTTAPGHAALVNAVAGHAYDLDDWEEPANTHPTVVLLPACLAAAHGQCVSGAELLGAYAVGFEVIVRLGEALTLDHYNRGFHSTATLGSIGAAAAVSRLLNLDHQATAHALSLAATQASGYTLQFGTHAKPLQAGFAARTGVESACLAKAGVTANPNLIESSRGFAGLLGDSDGSLKSLGKPWALSEYGIAFKLWPSCGYTHQLMTAAQCLRPQVVNRLDQIIEIEATLPDFHKQILPFDRPENYVQALFSAPACVAQILACGDLNIKDTAARFWEQPLVDQLIRRVRIKTEPAKNPLLNIDPQQPDRLRIHIDGEVLEKTCAYPIGAPLNPVSKEQLGQKFVSCSNLTLADFEDLLRWPESADIRQFWST